MSPLRDTVRVGLWGAAICVVWAIIGRFLQENALANTAAQAVFSEWACGRLGVAWSDPLRDPPEPRAIAGRVLRGVILGLGASVVVLAVATVSGAAKVVSVHGSLSPLAVGLAVAAFSAMRSELVEHGLVLRLLAPVKNEPVKIAVCALASGAVAFGMSVQATPSEIAATTAAGAAFGTLWLTERGAWVAWGARAAWIFATTAGVHGAIADVEVSSAESLLGARPAVAATTLLAVAAVALGLRHLRRAPRLRHAPRAI
ncbi:MAG: hypothetical protein HOO96_11885 [Polyangiaceae bacterium]|nr:hypothetical protein [Polyangiaceae bacterium]